MPQMAPINWLSLFILFLMTYLIFNMLNYFSFSLNINPMNNNNNNIKSNKTNNWTW